MKNLMLKTILGIVATFFAVNTNAQCPTITCLADISVNPDAGQCGAVVNFSAPEGIDLCTNQSITFTNCGVTGRLGPTQGEVDVEYTGGALDGQVTISTQGVQEWSVPITGLYTINVAGAKGGDANATYQGGLGASMQGDLLLTAGDQLEIIVGQKGYNAGYAGGGGASAVSLNNNPLIVAGGGGGANTPGDFKISGHDAVTGTNGVATHTPGGTAGNGASGGFAQGGAGYFSNGQNLGLIGIEVPESLLNGGTGGLGNGESYWGGFGGGGSGFGGGGGGGGYSGGSGGQYTYHTAADAPGGGGGSFNSGTNRINFSGVNADHGYVTITWAGAPVTTTQIAGLISGSVFPIGTTTNTFEANDGNGNIAKCSFNVIVSGLNVDVTVNDPTLTADNSDAEVSYQWIDCNNGNNPISGATSQSFTPKVNGSYAVVITLSSCSDTSACKTISTVSLDELSISGFKLYPNPNNGQFTVESVEVVEHYTVIDANGRLVHEGSPKSTSFKVNLDAYDTGMYYLNVNNKIIKVIKK